MFFLDTETCGLCGPAVIIQYAVDDGPIQIHNFWKSPVVDSLKLIDEILDNECVVGFNLAFDWFQICKIHSMLSLFINRGGDPFAFPEDHIEDFANLEADARDGLCLKPKSAIDLMLVARKTKYQITMNRGDVRIRRVPTILASHLAKHLEKEIVLAGILFARRKDKYAPKWKVYDCKKRVGGKEVVDPDFKDVVLKFKPSVALKALAIDSGVAKDDNVLLYQDVDVDPIWLPNEIPYAPFADAVRKVSLTGAKRSSQKLLRRIYAHRESKWRWAWPDVIQKHIDHWEYHERARLYASKDVEYTRGLYKFFDSPQHGDDDSVLACMVGAVRWRGYAIDIEGLKNLKEQAREKMRTTPMAAGPVRKYLSEVLDAAEQDQLKNGTGKVVLEELAKWKNQKCPLCLAFGDVPDPDCEACKGTGRYSHPVADRAQEVLDARMAKKEIELYDKLILAGRFHASVKVIGTLSSRMSGTDGLNAQGVKRTFNVRSKFTFALPGTKLVGGDFDGFEVVLADAAYNDEALRKALTSGKKIHALFAQELFPDKTYDEICKSKGSKFDMYDYGKRGVFSQIYGGDENTLVKKLGVSAEIALRASKGFAKRYPGVGKARQKVHDDFCSMRQEGGIGTRVTWADPKDYVESLFGFPRFFILENQICKALFNLACKPPTEWKKLGSKIKVQRRDREQTASGALASALYSAAFQLQAANTRAAANHVIQSSGAQITKHVQRKVWDLQPSGACPWKVQPLNVHDEILCVIDPAMEKLVEETVNAAVETYRPRVPLIKMEWHAMKSWAEK